MSDNDQALIDAATALFNERFNPPVHSVAAALRTKTGEIFTGLNIDHFSAYVCAETAALSDAINRKEYEFDTVVAVRQTPDGKVAVANMCGKCRQIFYDYAPQINVIVDDNGQTKVKNIDELLPFAFTRQRTKIQAVITGAKA
jgi:cytidine deaminase